MKHKWMLDKNGNIDYLKLDRKPHNGPMCERCGLVVCEHCHRDIYDEECPFTEEEK